VAGVAFLIAIGEASCKVAQVALPDRLTAQRAEGVGVGRPTVHEDELHVRLLGEATRTDAGRRFDAVLSTIAVRKAGTVIAPAKPTIVTMNSTIMDLLYCKGSEAVRSGLVSRCFHDICGRPAAFGIGAA
jgi:hypothetical protein